MIFTFKIGLWIVYENIVKGKYDALYFNSLLDMS